MADPHLAPERRDAFAAGDAVLFVDAKERLQLFSLQEGATSNIRGKHLLHDEVIGRPPGCLVRSRQGEAFHAFRPTLSDYALLMKRATTIVYPKDVGAILTGLDVFPGARVLEAGMGSGSLTLALLRAVGPEGHVVSCDLREASVGRARRNVEGWLGALPPNLTIEPVDVYDGLPVRDLDRIVLDLSEPWRLIPHAVEALRPGGGFAAYTPTAIQMQQTYQALEQSRRFGRIESVEVLQRTWHVSGRSLRPDHRMVGHTGFLTFGRLVTEPLTRHRPAASGDAGDDHAE